MYELLFDPKALEQLNKLPVNIRERILNKLEDAKRNPHRYFEKLAELKTYKIRVGNYRIIADIQDNKLIILVLKVGHRKNIYKK